MDPVNLILCHLLRNVFSNDMEWILACCCVRALSSNFPPGIRGLYIKGQLVIVVIIIKVIDSGFNVKKR